jgi:predicted HicB family RNase H-like nuclease
MTKKIINEKSLFNHYPKAIDQNQEIKNTLNQEIKNEQQGNKSDWKKVNFRIKEDLHEALKIQAVKNKMNLEDLFSQIIEEYLKGLQ